MKYRFSNKSIARLNTCDKQLWNVMNDVLNYFDISILDGYRDRERQDNLFRLKATRVEYPGSKHNVLPSKAVDVAPYPINFNDIERYYFLAGLVKVISEKMAIKIRWGGDWNGDNDFKNQHFYDLGHYELIE